MAISSPKMFASSGVEIDVSQLCFNKAHFTRSDFDVQRFMTLARRRSDLKTIHSDLRLYLKSIQHSMVELINEDYAHFVNLSSNLVGLKTSIDSINTSIDTVWKDFNETARDAVTQAEKIEQRCSQLTSTREAQQRLSRQITAISAMKKVRFTLRAAAQPLSPLSLERLSSLLVDVLVNESAIENDTAASKALSALMTTVADRLSDEFVASLRGDLALLPLLFSALSLCRLADRLVSRVVSEVVDAAIRRDEQAKTPLHSLNAVLEQITTVRSSWASKLGEHSRGHLMHFLDQTLLTFLLGYMDKNLSTRLTTSPSLFHAAFQSISLFISQWPSQSSASATHLHAIRARFQLQVYFLQIASAPWKELQAAADPAAFAATSDQRVPLEGDEAPLSCAFYERALQTVQALWHEDRWLPPLTGKSWEQTTKIIMLCVSYARTLIEHTRAPCSLPDAAFSPITILSALHVDCTRVGQLLFDHALIAIWPRLRECGVDTSVFGRTLYAFSSVMEEEAAKAKVAMVRALAVELDTLMDGVSQLPKQYRWTKKPAPTAVSPYITAVVERVQQAVTEAQRHGLDGQSAQSIGSDALRSAANTLVVKAKQVLETVNATGNSLSRLKRREGVEADVGSGSGCSSDEDKIKLQMALDLQQVLERIVAESDDQQQQEDEDQLQLQLQELLVKVQPCARMQQSA